MEPTRGDNFESTGDHKQIEKAMYMHSYLVLLFWDGNISVLAVVHSALAIKILSPSVRFRLPSEAISGIKRSLPYRISVASNSFHVS
jgi:hypothetical protein